MYAHRYVCTFGLVVSINMHNRRVIGAEMEGRQGRDCIVGERDTRMSQVLYMTRVNGGLAVNQRNVAMAATEKSIKNGAI